MKNFKFDLNAKVAIYVPSTTDVNVPTDNKKFVNKVMTKFSEWFGGCTSTPAVGGLGVEFGCACGRKCDYRVRFLHPGILRGALRRGHAVSDRNTRRNETRGGNA